MIQLEEKVDVLDWAVGLGTIMDMVPFDHTDPKSRDNVKSKKLLCPHLYRDQSPTQHPRSSCCTRLDDCAVYLSSQWDPWVWYNIAYKMTSLSISEKTQTHVENEFLLFVIVIHIAVLLWWCRGRKGEGLHLITVDARWQQSPWILMMAGKSWWQD